MSRWTIHFHNALALLALSGCASPGATPGRDGTPPQDVESPPTPTQLPTPAPPATPDASAPPTVASSAPTPDASHEDGWRAFLAALRSGESERVKERTTEAGYRTLHEGLSGDEPIAASFKRVGKGWGNWEVRWESVGPSRAAASMGPEVKAHGIWMVKEGPIWKVDRWAPGK